MKQTTKKLSVALLTNFIFCMQVNAYHLPGLNLGISNILDGGPVRPYPGWYWLQFLQGYTTDTFLDHKGCLLGGVRSPEFTSMVLITQFAYQFKHALMFKGKPGLEAGIPYVFHSHVTENPLNIASSGAGFGNLRLGAYLQWDPIIFHERPLFVHRLGISATFPTGKNRLPLFSINPGAKFSYVNPYWGATLYVTPRWAASWRLQYVWSSENKITHIQAGSTVYLNYSIEHEFVKGLWVAVNGYYLKQVSDSQLFGVPIPNSREQVFAIGPGALYFVKQGLAFFGHVYFESLVYNRSRGINFVARLVKHF